MSRELFLKLPHFYHRQVRTKVVLLIDNIFHEFTLHFTIDILIQSPSEQYCEDARASAIKCGYSTFEAWLTTGGDERSLIVEDTGANKYHIKPQPIKDSDVFRG